jgi:hypothetical protein
MKLLKKMLNLRQHMAMKPINGIGRMKERKWQMIQKKKALATLVYSKYAVGGESIEVPASPQLKEINSFQRQEHEAKGKKSRKK